MHGYSSSEESEDPKRPRAQPAQNNNNDQKKKRKKRLPPQQSVNRIWKKFSNRKFHKALSVLPFDPVQPPACSDRSNELLSDGYERAVEECRRKVEKIVKECKRVNQRYRDPGFDLDWDFKYEKGNCLNSLGSSKFELNSTTLLSSTASVPKAVKRVHEIYDKPTFMREVSAGDVKQGSLGDCWLLASLSALANVEGGIERICVAHDTKIGIYGFVFYRDGEWIYSIIDDKLYLMSPCWDSPSMQRDLLQQIDREDMEKHYRKTYQTGSKALFFAQSLDQNETWVPLLEKAFAKAHGDYASLAGGWIGEGLEDLSGGVTTELFTSDILDLDEFWENEMTKVNKEFLFGCSTGVMEHGYGNRDGISEGHAYVVMDARTLKSGQRLVKLRNPWGKLRKGLWEGPWSDGSKEWTTEVQEELGHKFGSDSVFWISFEGMISKYTLLDRTRLFREDDWRCCQRWIGVDVPWKPEYHEKFQIKLTQDSPLVLKLTQLDDRYFKGLQGQYTFRLHFRLHNLDEPAGEDYVVRSNSNYMTQRSVSVELPDMPAGSYAVYVKVVGERNARLSSVEQVVKRECQGRKENDKLAQVGHAYDLAHSKAWDHMNKVARVRRKREQKKASDCRMKERRRNWEKRHLNREASRQQVAKNSQKKMKRREAWETEQQRLDEEAEEVARQAREAKLAEEKPAAVVETADKAGDEADDESDDADADEKSYDKLGSESSGTPSFTPKSDKSVPASSEERKQDVPEVSGAPPGPAPEPEVKQPARQRPKYDSGDDSSDSPVDDWDEVYSSDDMIRKPRLAPQPAPQPKDDYDSEEEKMPEPWNAICIVGILVYSKDAQLELRTVIEGGELLEGGMGERGAGDLDNAQANAGGSRTEAETRVGYNASVVDRDGKVLTPGEGAVRDYINVKSVSSSGTSTPTVTRLVDWDSKFERLRL
ncbi:uncharacterized protein F5Z01DRAFT_617296 [Emericellopsis atlantica]|uniref:Calpain catalytic domain-containing protein n=1 Tax=Emericellopsis atlantica TaxID=2614577 RepID=A0A9P7ZRV5_9HYPO|nr:uncharacterized protein F5Z01DRAFT_617296 [Emericellopsis atlantica]KAG9257198.1 hypothetical protein F5Z01DRAFT_617296 [Emericellopsis atlantica]